MVFGQESVAGRGGAPQAMRDAVRPLSRKPPSTRFGEAAFGRAAEPARGDWAASGSLDDASHRLRLPFCPRPLARPLVRPWARPWAQRIARAISMGQY